MLAVEAARPVVQPTKFEMVINLKTRQSGLVLRLPLIMQMTADEVID